MWGWPVTRQDEQPCQPCSSMDNCHIAPGSSQLYASFGFRIGMDLDSLFGYRFTSEVMILHLTPWYNRWAVCEQPPVAGIGDGQGAGHCRDSAGEYRITN